MCRLLLTKPEDVLKLMQTNYKLMIDKEKLEIEKLKVKPNEDNKEISENNYINDFLNAIKPDSPILKSEGEDVIPS